MVELGFWKELPNKNNNFNYRIFVSFYDELLSKYQSFIPDRRLKGLSIRNMIVIYNKYDSIVPQNHAGA